MDYQSIYSIISKLVAIIYTQWLAEEHVDASTLAIYESYMAHELRTIDPIMVWQEWPNI